MHVVNCHQNTEAADLLGGLRPLRGRDVLVEELRDRAKVFVERCAKTGCNGWDDFEWKGDNLEVVGVLAAVQVRHSLGCIPVFRDLLGQEERRACESIR